MLDFSDHPLAVSRLTRLMDALTAGGIIEAEIRDTHRPDRLIVLIPAATAKEEHDLHWAATKNLRKHGFDNRWCSEVEGHACFQADDMTIPPAFETARIWAQKIVDTRDERRSALWANAMSFRHGPTMRRSDELWDRASFMEEVCRSLSKAHTFADLDKPLQMLIESNQRWIDRVGVIAQEPGFDKGYAGRVQDGTRRNLRRTHALRRLAMRHLGHI